MTVFRLVCRQGKQKKFIEEKQPLIKIERYSFPNSKDIQILFFPVDKPHFKYILSEYFGSRCTFDS